MTLFGLTELSLDARRERVFKELVANFQGTYDTDVWEGWIPFLNTQDPEILTEAINTFVRKASANSWVPTIKQISAEINGIYQNRHLKEAQSRALLVCKECSGKTWITIDSNTSRPCSMCLTETFNRWQAGNYESFGYREDESELTGPSPDNERMPPTPPRTDTGAPVSAERAKQFEDFIMNGNGHDTIDDFLNAKLEQVEIIEQADSNE